MEVDVVISNNEVFFFNIPPKKLIKLLKKYGLEFKEGVVYCG